MTHHLEIQELLPWFVNGSLNEAEQSLVDEHLDDCDDCSAAVKQLIDLSARFNSAGPAIASPDINTFIDNLPPQAATVPRRSRWQVPVLAACALLVVAAVSMTYLMPDDVYRTLSRSEPGHHSRPVVQVVFSPEATEREIRELLLQGDNQVLSGPSRHGVYRVLLGQTQRSDIYIARLKHNPDVIFVDREEKE